MTNFWESSFQDKREMWGFEPADSARNTAELFQKNGLKNILIPGFGYGRNAKAFADKGCEVTGIEISETAIDMATKHYGNSFKIYHGSVGDMPFDDNLYDGIFCYALIHLLDENGRKKLIQDCYDQLNSNGLMVFVAISTNDATYGQGTALGKDWFESKHGVRLFYYKLESIRSEFGNHGLIDAVEVNEPSKKFWVITCKK